MRFGTILNRNMILNLDTLPPKRFSNMYCKLMHKAANINITLSILIICMSKEKNLKNLSSDHKLYLESTSPNNLLRLNFSHSLEVEIYQELVLSTSKRFFLLMLVT